MIYIYRNDSKSGESQTLKVVTDLRKNRREETLWLSSSDEELERAMKTADFGMAQ